jgi:hypothetical protein
MPPLEAISVTHATVNAWSETDATRRRRVRSVAGMVGVSVAVLVREAVGVAVLVLVDEAVWLAVAVGIGVTAVSRTVIIPVAPMTPLIAYA